jgi:hypothetical protein
MGLISRLHMFLNGTTNDGSQVAAEFDQVYGAINGGLDDSNISGSGTPIQATKVAQIPPARVLDHADSEAEYKTTTTPGDTGSPILPSTLEEEWERMRYRVAANKLYQTAVHYMDSSGPTATIASWTEPPIVGRNLLPNPGFEAPLVSSTPPGWTLIATPTLAIENPADASTGVEKRSLNITTNASNEGISCIVGGLKRNGKYLIGMRYTRTAGTINLTTTNALASGDYQNLNLTDSNGSTVEVLQGIVRAEDDSAPSPITVSIFCSLTGAEFNIHDVWMYELSDGAPNDLPAIPMQTARDITASTFPTTWTGSGAAWRTDTLTSLSLTQYVPWAGYRLIYEVSVPYNTIDSAASREASRVYLAIQQNIDGAGAANVAGPVIMEIRGDTADMRDSGSFFLRHVVENPTPGTEYAFTTLLGVYDDTNFEQISVPPLVGGVQMAADARLIVERS